MILSAAHQRGEDLVVVLTAAQVARDAVGEFLARRIGMALEIADRRHHEAGHAERALESLLVHHRLLHRVQRPVAASASPSIVTTRRPRTVCVRIEQE